MKKKIFLSILALTAALTTSAQSIFSLDEQRPAPQREVRAIWLTTLKGLDWPKKPAVTPEATTKQKAELCKILDQLQAAGINTVLFQSRIRATTAYPSAIEPWDGVFTGVPGKAPLYDPLQFALDECHKRGMELHAWVVAFPICPVNVAKKLGKRALPHQRPELCQRCGDQWMMDPGVPGTDDYIASVCEEIVKKYDVDGIHMDYIRYPEKGIPFNDKRTYRKYGQKKNLTEWRRENVTRVAQKIHDAVKKVRPWVKISCSPVGKHADLVQQSSYGWNAREAVYQDAQAWLKKGYMDILFPMMYFDGKHFFPFAQDWQNNAYGRQVVPGLGVYFLHPRQKNWDLDVIRRQMYFTREIGAAGQAQFRSMFFTDNVKGLYDFTTYDFYHQRVLTPPMVWEDSIAPAQPHPTIDFSEHKIHLAWEPSTDNQSDVPVTYNVYYCPSDSFSLKTAEALAFRVSTCNYSFMPVQPERQRGYYAVTAIDAFGNESAAQPVTAFHPVVSLLKRVPDNGLIPIAPADEAEYILISDIARRPLLQIPMTDSVQVNALAPGFYDIRTIGKKGKCYNHYKMWKNP